MNDHGAQCYHRFLSGDISGFEDVVREYRGGLILFIQQYVRDYALAEDVSQDVFVKLFVKKPHYSPKASFKTWLYTIGKREAINFSRRHKPDIVEITDAAQQIEEAYLEQIMADRRQITLYYALDELHEDYRRVLHLRYLEDMPVEEIAHLLHKKPKQISDLLYNAKKALISVIDKGGSKYEILRPSNS